MVEDLFVAIQQCELNKEIDNEWEWGGRYLEEYMVKDVYSKIVNANYGDYEEVL